MKTIFQRCAAVCAFVFLLTGISLASDSMIESLRPLKGAEFEQKFLSQMIAHHRQGIEMAKLPPHHSQQTELKQLAATMSQMQQEEVEQMTSLLSGTGGKPNSAPDSMQKMHQASMEKLEATRGAEFDRTFIERMIKHHSDGLEMAQLATTRATRQEVVRLAEKIVREQKEDIEKLKRLRG